MDMAGATIAVIGRLCSAPRWLVADAVARRGGSLTHRLAKADGLVVGRGAHLRLGALTAALDAMERRGAWCLSERRLLRALGLAAPLPALPRPLRAIDVARHSGLAPDAVRMLALFDVIDDADGAFEFRDLVAARQVRRLAEGGTALADIIAALVAADHQPGAGNLLSHARLTRLADGVLARAVGDYLAEIDGQLRLPLDDGGNPSLDLLFERAAMAEEAERWAEAETHYRRILDIAPRDSVARFNLANVLGRQRRLGEAEACLRHAVALRPGFAEAWYNLAHLLESRGDAAAARRCLERAVEADSGFADGIYNLARLCLMAGEPVAAAALYERYVTLDPSSPWAARARQALRLCRVLRPFPEEPP